jgi:hypothetical protein
MPGPGVSVGELAKEKPAAAILPRAGCRDVSNSQTSLDRVPGTFLVELDDRLRCLQGRCAPRKR